MELKNTIANKVKIQIDAFDEGYVFSYLDIEAASKNREAIIKSLNRLVEKGVIDKLTKGKFYKPTKSESGRLGPHINEIVKDLLANKKEIIGYLTGFSAINKFGLTTQISNTIKIGRNTFKPPLKRGIYTIQFVLQKNLITKENVKILQILDCLKMLKGIPDTTRENLLSILGIIIRMIFENERIMGPLDKIRETLNPISTYNIGIKQLDRFLKEKWGIK
jgi:predicted transcriptional regulator of viral defense system